MLPFTATFAHARGMAAGGRKTDGVAEASEEVAKRRGQLRAEVAQ